MRPRGQGIGDRRVDDPRYKSSKASVNAETLNEEKQGGEEGDWLDCPSRPPSFLRASIVNEESMGEGSMVFYYC